MVAPEVPIQLEGVTYQEGNTLESLEPFIQYEGTLTWYADEALTQEIPSSTVIVVGVSYYVTQKDGGCESQALTTGIGADLNTNPFDRNEFVYYPNPVTDILYFTSAEPIQLVEVYDLNGRLVRQDKSSAGVTQISLSGLPQAAYVVKAHTAQQVRMFKVVKN